MVKNETINLIFKGDFMEIVIYRQVKNEWIIALCILIIVAGLIARSYYVKNAKEYSQKLRRPIILVFIALGVLLMLNPFLSSVDYCFNNSKTAIVNVEKIIISANLTQIRTTENLRNFRIDTSREEDSILESYFAGHICEIEYLEFGRDIIKIKVLE